MRAALAAAWPLALTPQADRDAADAAARDVQADRDAWADRTGAIVATGDPRDDDGPSDDVLDRWPRIRGGEFHGVAGELVWAADPHVEADPAAVLIQLLVSLGCYLSQSAYVKVGASKHPTLLYAVLVGTTGTGRKGTAWDVVAHLLNLIDEAWFKARCRSGLVSGEGLIFHMPRPEL